MQDLLRRGPWLNESEIIRHGIELVRLELERESLTPLSDAERAACYADMSEEEIAADHSMGEASLKAQQGRC